MTSEAEEQGIFANRGVIVLAVVAGLALLAVIILGILLLRTRDDESAGGGTPTPFASNLEGIPLNEALVVGIDGNSTISITIDAPVLLTVADQSYKVKTDAIAADRVWTPQIENEQTAVWVYGSIVNYVIGVPDSDANRAVMERLLPGDEIVLTTRGGVAYTFSFNSQRTVANTNPDVFAQNTPGITLVLFGREGSERMVVNGRYLVSESNTGQSNVVNLGETTQLDNLQITVSSVAYVPERLEIPAGFAFFQIDYEIQNIGLTAFDTNLLELIVIDNIGNQYALNPLASQLGNYPVLTGFLNAGQSKQVTAGYQLPLGLTSDSLNWIVARKDSGAQIQVIIPFTGSRSSAAQRTDIQLQQASVSDDLTSLVLTGQITNLNSQPIVVTEPDIALTTQDGASYLMLATNPPFPWSIAAGQTMQFAVTFQRPASATAVFTVMSQSFQLSGLR
jgi:hypothetical protein